MIWDEDFYLQTHPDVQTAVHAGHLRSGKAHWDQYGQNEGRAHRWVRTDPAKPTIVLFTPSLNLGGAEQWICYLAKYARQFNWVISCLSTDYWHPIIGASALQYADVHTTSSVTPGVHVHNNRDELVRRTLAMADLVVVWAEFDFPPVDVPVVFAAHGSCKFTRRAACSAIACGATHFAAVSEKAALALQDVLEDVTVIWNGADEDRLIPQVAREALRCQWGGVYDSVYDYYIGYLGRLGNEKNLDSIIHAVASLPFHYKLVLIGSVGWAQDRILPLARTLLPGRLIEFPPTDNVGTPLNGLDCLVSASPREGFPFAVIEALLCGVPVISTNVGVIPELHARTRQPLVEVLPHDPTSQEIALAIRNVCNDPPTARTSAALTFAKENLTAITMSAKWEQYFLEILRIAPRQTETRSRTSQRSRVAPADPLLRQ